MCSLFTTATHLFAQKFDIIDYDVGVPGHGNDVVDGLNTVTKRYIRNAMFKYWI